jgi:hypothetical protein
MPIKKKWSSFRKKRVKKTSDVYAVYELADRSKDVIYIGEGILRDRLLAHVTNGSDPIPETSYFRYEITESKNQCEQLQNALLAEYFRVYGRLPKYNQQSHA